MSQIKEKLEEMLERNAVLEAAAQQAPVGASEAQLVQAASCSTLV